ncbi:MAG: hypothetical protein SGCHY_004075, partial [Lobulomycetales sp.]
PFGTPSSDTPDSVSLLYPSGTQESCALLVPRLPEEHAPILDLLETCKLIASCISPLTSPSPSPSRTSPSRSTPANPYGSERKGPLRQIVKCVNKRDRAGLVRAVDAFNTVTRGIPIDYAHPDSDAPGSSFELARHVLEQSYARVVSPFAGQLIVKGFGSNVYGELKPLFIDEMIRELGLQSGDVFVDLGSGIGNVACQVAGQCLAECFGVELQKRASELAVDFSREFLARIRCFNKPCGTVTLYNADFLECPEIDAVLPRADVLLVNNYIFSPTLNQALAQKFLDLREGTRIVSLKPFGTAGREGASVLGILNEPREVFYGRDRVSWTSEGGSYFIQTVDREGMLKRNSLT